MKLLLYLVNLIKNSNGVLDAAECREGLNELLGYDLFSDEQKLKLFLDHFDLNHDSTINYQEFAAKFEIVFKKVEKKNEKFEEWIAESLREISRVLFTKYISAKDLHHFFIKIDTDEKGYWTYDDFVSLVKHLKLHKKYDKEFCKKLAKFLDKNNDQRIDYVEFKNYFSIEALDGNWHADILQYFCGILFANKLTVEKLMDLLDEDNDGRISKEEFKKGVKLLDKVFYHFLTEKQIEKLFDVIDEDKSGFIDHHEFVDNLTVCDSKKSGRKNAAK